jgi:hypothetical protein
LKVVPSSAGSGRPSSPADTVSIPNGSQKFAHFLELARIVGGNHETAGEPPMCAL